jgi:hypothetical protein
LARVYFYDGRVVCVVVCVNDIEYLFIKGLTKKTNTSWSKIIGNIEIEVDFYDSCIFVFNRCKNFRYKESFKNHTFRNEFDVAYRIFLERCKND